ncbi:toll/interleukin-1 receptor domain-containing protein [Paractinoplanes rishiriensis]|uniref:toll/interleukin-1 receptor domain-containing protein n=1 Tax=Paractinoplanes rishiriensis TaxID=1050105 RepID=UPI0023B2A2F3|nr:TIR domain-containing protein [Actinoplanes rishiriensis]
MSHSSRDTGLVDELRERLVARGYRSLFVDFDPEFGIPAGRAWEREIYQRLRQCRAVVLVCSAASMASQWVFAESGWDERRPPYPGMVSFQEPDAPMFFGREDDVQRGVDLLNRLRRFGEARLAVILGASGSGKSSLLRAGLLPRLRRDAADWRPMGPIRPARDRSGRPRSRWPEIGRGGPRPNGCCARRPATASATSCAICSKTTGRPPGLARRRDRRTVDALASRSRQHGVVQLRQRDNRDRLGRRHGSPLVDGRRPAVDRDARGCQRLPSTGVPRTLPG